jgi:hypothetical protein
MSSNSQIEIEELSASEFRVRVIEGHSESSHVVTVQPPYRHKLTGEKAEAEELLRRSFEFLLEREPKESILARFDLSMISRYFPEYEKEISRRLAGR